jgi:protein ImuB
MMKRVMCIYFPKWPLQRLCAAKPELRGNPVGIADHTTNRGSYIQVCSPSAARSGIRAGMPVAEAMAINPYLRVEEENPEKDRLFLEELAVWGGRYSPIVGLEEGPAPENLLLDITGCAGCFHGEDRLAERATRELKETGWFPRVAIANTIGAAWAVAHHCLTPCVIASETTEQVLSPLPVSSLRLLAPEVDALLALGVEQIGHLAQLPRASLASRFSPVVLRRLDQALGRLPEVITPQDSMPEAQAYYSLDYATDRLDVLIWVLDRLVKRIHTILEKRNQGARQVDCWLYQERSESLHFEVFLFRPSRSASHIGDLLQIRLEKLCFDDAVNAIRLRIPVAEPLIDRQADFLDLEKRPDEKALSALIDQLSSRLGPEVVTRAVLVPDPQPEYASRFEAVTRQRTEDRGQMKGRTQGVGKRKRANFLPSVFCPLSSAPHRPLRLWSPQPISAMSLIPDGPPIRFRWQGKEYNIVRAWGPERIEAGWWRGRDVHRDYYIAATDLGPRFWLFRCQQDGLWFMHGCFD